MMGLIFNFVKSFGSNLVHPVHTGKEHWINGLKFIAEILETSMHFTLKILS